MATYYDLSDANDRVDELRPLLEGLRADRETVARTQGRLDKLRGGNGNDEQRIELDKVRNEMGVTIKRMEAAVHQIDAWDITLRDITTGLVDFPALASGRPIWLCWKLGETDIAWWHEIDTGIAGRKPLIELE
jgi:hypothetical protein